MSGPSLLPVAPFDANAHRAEEDAELLQKLVGKGKKKAVEPAPEPVSRKGKGKQKAVDTAPVAAGTKRKATAGAGTTAAK
jgi:hypothetical protein